jgi:hypothetical protein
LHESLSNWLSPAAGPVRHPGISAAALIVVFSIVEGVGRRLDHPPFRLHDSEQVSTVAVGRLIGEVAVVASLPARQ